MLFDIANKLLIRRGYRVVRSSEIEGSLQRLQKVRSDVDRLQESERLALNEVASLRGRVQAIGDELRFSRLAYLVRVALQAVQPDHNSLPSIDRRTLDQQLLSFLRNYGVPLGEGRSVFLHVGFGHSGTTSLQRNFFGRRRDIDYLGTPYSEAGGLFSNLKYLDDAQLNEQHMLDSCRDCAYRTTGEDSRPIVVSDETFCDTSEIFYCPRHLPGDTIAARLKRYFPTAKVIFTVRNQVNYVISMYFNLKRNYAFLAGMLMPGFTEWWSGMHTQVRCLYLQNLDYSYLIGVYTRLFGRENVLLLPLEELKARGGRHYLERLCRFMNLEPGDEDVEAFSLPRNERMTVVENRLAELIAAGSAEWPNAIRSLLEKESMSHLVCNAPRLELRFDEEQRRQIAAAVVEGNRRLEAEFDLPLTELGYMT